MIVFLKLTTAGVDSGPFDLYSNLDGYSEPFEENVSRALLVAGYSTTVPDNATIVRITSKEDCISSVDITLRDVECNLEGYTGEITTTSTSTSSTTTTTTTAGCNITSPLVLSQGTSAEDACTRFSNPDNTATYYTSTGTTFPAAVFLNQTPICTQPAGSGWYSDGEISRYYDSSTGNFALPVTC